MRLSHLRPDYYDYFPTFACDELGQRLESLPFHIATMLGLNNLRRAAEHPLGREGLRTYFSRSKSVQGNLLQDVLINAGISSRVASAIGRVPRERFALPQFHQFSYLNHYLPFSMSSCVSAPGLVALMLEQLRIEPEQHLVEIGIGSGYHAACASEVVQNVCSIAGWDLNRRYIEFGTAILNSLGYENIAVNEGNGLSENMRTELCDRLYVTAASFDGLPPELIRSFHHGLRLQFVRAITRTEFELGKL